MSNFVPGTILQQGDLDVHFQDGGGQPTNVFNITYDIYFVNPGPPETEVLIPPSPRIPKNPSVGTYYASLMVPPGANPGTYRIRWSFQEASGQPVQEVVMEFEVITPNTTVFSISSAKQDCVDKLRLLLRDQNPDKFYKFAPPEHEGRIGKFNRVFGQIWEDEELLCYLEMGLLLWNMYPPETSELCSIDQLAQSKPEWKIAIIWAAIVHAMFALALNWIQDEFSYSIGGISLDINKSSKYESLKGNAEGQFDKLVEIKPRTTKIIRGLRQNRFGIGIRSAFGPNLASGILGPRAFIG